MHDLVGCDKQWRNKRVATQVTNLFQITLDYLQILNFHPYGKI